MTRQDLAGTGLGCTLCVLVALAFVALGAL